MTVLEMTLKSTPRVWSGVKVIRYDWSEGAYSESTFPPEHLISVVSHDDYLALKSRIDIATSALEQIDAEWCKHTGVHLVFDSNKRVDRYWCAGCSQWVRRGEINLARTALSRIAEGEK